MKATEMTPDPCLVLLALVAGVGGCTGLLGVDLDYHTDGVFVAVGACGRRVRSVDDGLSWVDDVPGECQSSDYDVLNTVAPGPRGFVALGWHSWTSPDGKSWTNANPSLSTVGGPFSSTVYANNQFVAVGVLRAVSTDDGVTWTPEQGMDGGVAGPYNTVVYGDVMGGRYVSAADTDDVLSYSSDGVTWTDVYGPSMKYTNLLAFGNGVFVGLGTNQVRSTDGGETWNDVTFTSAQIRGLVFADNQFLAVANDVVFTSKDGTTWLQHPVSGLEAGAIAYGDGTYVMVSGSARRRSLDGLVWDPPIDDGDNALNAVTFGP